MSNLLFPSWPALDREYSRSIEYRSVKQTSDSGKELRILRQASPRYHYSLRFNGLRGSLSEWQDLVSFFATHAGTWDSFLFTDPVDGATRRVRFDSDEIETTAIVASPGRSSPTTTGVFSASVELISVL